MTDDLSELEAACRAATPGWPANSRVGSIDARNTFRDLATPEAVASLIAAVRAGREAERDAARLRETVTLMLDKLPWIVQGPTPMAEQVSSGVFVGGTTMEFPAFNSAITKVRAAIATLSREVGG